MSTSTTTSPTTKITADELRQSLLIGFQPSIANRPELLAEVIENLAEQYAAAGVTERRLRNAAERVELGDEHYLPLVHALFRATDRRANAAFGSCVADAIGASSWMATATEIHVDEPSIEAKPSLNSLSEDVQAAADAVEAAQAALAAAEQAFAEAREAEAEAAEEQAAIEDGVVAHETFRLAIIGPNLFDQSKGSFHVHTAECRDGRNGRKYPLDARWEGNFVSRIAACVDVYGDMIYSDHGMPEGTRETLTFIRDDYLGDLYFHGCTAAVPEHVGGEW